MKKIFYILAFILSSSCALMADDDKPVTFNQLPEKAQKFINTYFAKDSISYAKKDTEWFDGEYEVFFMNGDKVEFRSNGDCKKIKSRKAVPNSIIPKAIVDYITSKYPNQTIIEYKYNHREYERYEIKLKSGLELIFSSKCNFIRYDD